jgi:glycosyltransferase involved in cell wall biosynthesis
MKIKLIFCGHDFKFISSFIKYCQEAQHYDVRILDHKGHVIDDEIAAEEALNWADVIFCEWGLGNAVWFSQRKKEHQTLIVRLHLQEVQARNRLAFIWQTRWESVDRLILITHHIYDWMQSSFPLLNNKCSLVYNPIPALKEYNKAKSIDSIFTLGFVGAVPARKRLDLAVKVLKKIRQIDSRFILRVKGSLPSEYPWMKNRINEMAWYDEVFLDAKELQEDKAIFFDSHGSDMSEWYSKIGHILSLSDFEGSHQAVAEGMASGAVPAIRDWEGADRIYPAKYVHSSIDEIAEAIIKNSSNEIFSLESAYSRGYSQKRFDESEISQKLDSIIQREIYTNKKSNVSAVCSKSSLKKLPSFMILAYIPIGNKGGYRIRVEQEIKILSQIGCKVHLICFIPPKSASKKDSLIYDDEISMHKDDLSLYGCNLSIIEIDDFFRMEIDQDSFPEQIKEIIQIIDSERIDIVHAEALYCARIGSLIKNQASNIYFSIDWHGATPEEAIMGGAHPNRIKCLEVNEKKLLQECNLNIFVSNEMRKHYQTKYLLPIKNNVIVPCCIADERITKSNLLSNLHENDTQKFIFTYTGTMADWQCGNEMLRLFSMLYKFENRCFLKLIIPETDHQKVFEFIESNNLPKSAFEIFEVPHAEVTHELAMADIGLLLRKNDVVNKVSSPTKFGEYLAAGIPILMTNNIGDFSSWINKNIGLILPDNIFDQINDTCSNEDLKNIINFVEKIKSNKARVGQECKSFARESLSWINHVQNWIAIYEKSF